MPYSSPSRRGNRARLVAMLLMSLAGTAPASLPTTGIALLDDPAVQCANPLPDFSYAGYRHGLEPLPRLQGTVIDVRSHGAVADDDGDDSKALLAAMQAAEAVQGPVIVQLPPGRLIISEVIPVQRSQLVIRGYGKGRGGSELYFPRPLRMVDRSDTLDELREYLRKYEKRQVEKAKNIDLLFSEYSWSGGFLWIKKPGTRAAPYLESHDRPSRETRLARARTGQAGSLQLDVDSTARLKVGDAVQLRWFNRDGQGGALLRELYGDTDLKIGSHHWTFPDRPLVIQTARITAVDGSNVTLSAPLLHPIGPGLEADIARWEHLEQVGIEDLALVFPDEAEFGHHLEQGYNGIYLTSVFDGWIRDVRIDNADSGVLSYNSGSVTISGVETHGRRRAHYSVHMGNVHGVLVRDLQVFNRVVHPLSVNTQSTRSVFTHSEVFVDPVIDQHAGSNHQNLFDALTLHLTAKPGEGGTRYDLWQGSGAGYWEPGHGRYNTSWNFHVVVEGGARPDQKVTLAGLEEGPQARVVGVWGNREFAVDYRPAPYQESVNKMPVVPSLYDYQLQLRRNGQRWGSACAGSAAAVASAGSR